MHECGDHNIGCVLNISTNSLIVFIKNRNFKASFCPFCGYKVKKNEIKNELEKPKNQTELKNARRFCV